MPNTGQDWLTQKLQTWGMGTCTFKRLHRGGQLVQQLTCHQGHQHPIRVLGSSPGSTSDPDSYWCGYCETPDHGSNTKFSSSWLWGWPTPRCCGHLRSKSMDRRSLSPSAFQTNNLNILIKSNCTGDSSLWRTGLHYPPHTDRIMKSAIWYASVWVSFVNVAWYATSPGITISLRQSCL